MGVRERIRLCTLEKRVHHRGVYVRPFLHDVITSMGKAFERGELEHQAVSSPLTLSLSPWPELVQSWKSYTVYF